MEKQARNVQNAERVTMFMREIDIQKSMGMNWPTQNIKTLTE